MGGLCEGVVFVGKVERITDNGELLILGGKRCGMGDEEEAER